MLRSWVRATLAERNSSLEHIADQLGVKLSSLCGAFNNGCPRYQRAIADACGVSPDALWPQNHATTPPGTPIDEAARLAPIPTHPLGREHWIRYQLAMRLVTVASLAKKLGISPEAAQTAFRRSYPRVEAVIAEAIGMNPSELWPERYQPNDQWQPGAIVSWEEGTRRLTGTIAKRERNELTVRSADATYYLTTRDVLEVR
jgi:lambda repressor-like predicted transcriptional regulator